jgi:hypothetical protein
LRSDLTSCRLIGWRRYPLARRTEPINIGSRVIHMARKKSGSIFGRAHASDSDWMATDHGGGIV